MLNISADGLQDTVRTIITVARDVRRQAESTKTTIESGAATADHIINIMRGLQGKMDILNAAKAMPGLIGYARVVFDNNALDIVAELNAITAQMADTINWVGDNFPKDASGWLLKDKIVNGAIENRTFTPAQMSGLSTRLGNLIALFA